MRKWKVGFKSGATRIVAANDYNEVIERLTWERSLVNKTYESYGVISIVLQG